MILNNINTKGKRYLDTLSNALASGFFLKNEPMLVNGLLSTQSVGFDF